jgi:hypothetical protein
MKLTVLRYYDDGETTSGLLFIDGKFECYTCEDQHRDKKVMGDTRIPSREYQLGLRTEGGHHERYSKKFPKDHVGMLHVLDVPGFEYILIHIGNTEADTAGCLLVGNQITKEGKLVDSTGAYESMYKKVAPKLKSGEKVTINYLDIKQWALI